MNKLIKPLSLSALAVALGGLSIASSLKPVQMTNAANADYALVGYGSFVTGDNWSAAGGKRMQDSANNNAELKGVFLSAGDVFQLRHVTNDWWYGHSKLHSATFDTGERFNQASFNYYKITSTADWGWEQTDFTRDNYSNVNGSSGALDSLDGQGTRDIYWFAPDWWLANDFSYQGVRYYSKDTDEKWVDSQLVDASPVGGNIYKATVPNKSDLGFNIYRSNGKGNDASTPYITLSAQFNNNIVVNTEGYYDIFLTTGDEIYIEDTLLEWANAYLHFNDYDTEIHIGETGDNYCLDSNPNHYYSSAKNALLSLGEDVCDYFSTNGSTKYGKEYARYMAWADANKDETPFEANDAARVTGNINQVGVEYTPIIIAGSIVALASATLVGFTIARKKHQ